MPDPTERIEEQKAFRAAQAALSRVTPLVFSMMGLIYGSFVFFARSDFGLPSGGGFPVGCAIVSAISFGIAIHLHFNVRKKVEHTRHWMMFAGTVIHIMTGWVCWLTGDPAMTPFFYVMTIAAGYFFLHRLDFILMALGAVLGFIAGWVSPLSAEGWSLAAGQLLAMLAFGIALNTARRQQVIEFARLRRINEERNEELRASEERWRGFAENARDIIALIDRNNTTLYLNSRFTEMFGYDRGKVLGRDPVDVLIPEHQQQARENRERWWDGSGADEVHAACARTQSGEIKWVEVSATRIHLRGKEMGLTLVARDITERRLLEEQLRHTQKEEGMSLMAAGVAHDFNNLLAVVLGETELAQQNQAPPAVRDNLLRIEDATERARALTHQLLAYSGHAVTQRCPLDISEQVRRTRNLFRSVLPPAVELIVELNEELPAVEADPTQLQQVVMNLLWNATEASDRPGGRVVIRTRTEELDRERLETLRSSPDPKPGLYVCLEIQDNGHGMNEETLRRLFDPFYSTRADGRGLGLAALSGIVRSHRGSVEVQSREQSGSTFRIYLPATEQTIRPTTSIDEPAVCGEGQVLVVDDEEMVRNMISALLRSIGYTTVEASGGNEAIKLLQADPQNYRFTVLDMTMPGMDGAATLDALRKIAPNLPILLSSGYSENRALQRVRDSPGVVFLQKPYSRADLASAVALLLDETRPALTRS